MTRVGLRVPGDETMPDAPVQKLQGLVWRVHKLPEASVFVEDFWCRYRRLLEGRVLLTQPKNIGLLNPLVIASPAGWASRLEA
ncbi:hypothetical protein NDU88_007359 [Pleurodeles waltl]|uniref:Uncharacterized protein n=1 Tax=Pleurodeles waltl TaxID=8319 RepID=A0AAV7MFU1_PLEWA|nr:hypothetical protein NDU88_007359 [Pleurodeles waltl]